MALAGTPRTPQLQLARNARAPPLRDRFRGSVGQEKIYRRLVRELAV